jgi:hypothetical protein
MPLTDTIDSDPEPGALSGESRLLEIILPDNGAAIMFEAYFDESGTHINSPLMCVAGYLIETDQRRRLQAEWGAVLARHGVPYFHAVECIHGTGAFKGMDVTTRSAICESLINLVKIRVDIGICVSVCETDYLGVMPPGINVDAYTFCAQQCMQGVVAWAEKYNYRGPVSYFFEAGHRSEPKANAFIDWIRQSRSISQGLRYHSHTFVSNGKILAGIAAADFLAWQWCKAYRNKYGETRRPVRSDFQSLMCKTHIVMHFRKDDLAELCAYRAARDAGEDVGPIPEKFRRFLSTRDVSQKTYGEL